MSIRQLPEDVVNRLKSSVAIISLNGVACGLVKNALDAGASRINIYIDYSRGNCTVEDNGLGIAPDEFKPDGGLGKLHHTSRFPSSSRLHGRHGDFLAALGTLSLLSVVSHHRRHVSQNSATIHHGEVLARHLPCPLEQRFHTFDHGTRVTVRDLFGSMPVRVKHRAALSTETSYLDKEWRRLTSDIVALLLAWPSNVTVFVRESIAQRERRLKAPETTDKLSRASRLLIQLGMADSSDADSWVPVSASAGQLMISGCISLNPVATRGAQFLSFGIRPVTNEHGTNVLFQEINAVFSGSSFGVVEHADEGGQAAQNPPKIRKGIERWPMFYLRVQLPSGTQTFDLNEVLDGRQTDVAAIVDLLRALCYGFLKKHHMRPQKVRMSADESVFSTRTTRSSRTSNRRAPSSRIGTSRASDIGITLEHPSRIKSPFNDWQRIKVGRPTISAARQKLGASDVLSQGAEINTKRRLVGDGGRLLCRPFDDPSPEPDDLETRHTAQGERTASGNDAAVPSSEAIPDRAYDGPLEPPQHRSGKISVLEKRPKAQPSEWLQGVLRSWDNPVFETVEPSVPRAYQDLLTSTHNARSRFTSHRCGEADDSVMFNSASANLDGRISKSMLSQAEVISQVDRKFILVKLPLVSGDQGRSSSALVMLDQHAADERCRLEDLMGSYFEKDSATGALRPVVEELGRPFVFEVSDNEARLLEQYRGHFSAWGIVYHAPSKISVSIRLQEINQSKVTVTGLPPSILERCRSEPRLLIDLVRKEVWKIHENGAPPKILNRESGSGEAAIATFYGCPRGILELLHSRSCRSAIMFNDVLSKSDCIKLVERLSRCVFPFQCAHGRPSMAPLVDLGSGGRIGGWSEDGGSDRVGLWKRWAEA